MRSPRPGGCERQIARGAVRLNRCWSAFLPADDRKAEAAKIALAIEIVAAISAPAVLPVRLGPLPPLPPPPVEHYLGSFKILGQVPVQVGLVSRYNHQESRPWPVDLVHQVTLPDPGQGASRFSRGRDRGDLRRLRLHPIPTNPASPEPRRRGIEGAESRLLSPLHQTEGKQRARSVPGEIS
jgi:hypothetical protein